MDNNEVKVLIESFKAYRDLLTPIQTGLNEFVDTYDLLRENVDKLNASFGGEAKQRLESIYKNLASQAEKASDLASRIDQFSVITGKYSNELNRLISLLSKLSDKLSSVNEIEAKAEEQIGRLDTIIEEKNKNYNVRELQRTLDNYNNSVQKVSEFINRDVAETLSGSQKKLEGISVGVDEILKKQRDDAVDIEKLVDTYNSTNAILRKIAETEDVNEEYIYLILDKWAESRRVKVKK